MGAFPDVSYHICRRSHLYLDDFTTVRGKKKEEPDHKSPSNAVISLYSICSSRLRAKKEEGAVCKHEPKDAKV